MTVSSCCCLQSLRSDQQSPEDEILSETDLEPEQKPPLGFTFLCSEKLNSLDSFTAEELLYYIINIIYSFFKTKSQNCLVLDLNRIFYAFKKKKSWL